MTDAPAWMVAQVEAFGQRLEQMCAAYLARTRRRSDIVYDDRRLQMAMLVSIEPVPGAEELHADDPVLHLARCLAPEWVRMAGGVEPEDAILVLLVSPDGAAVQVRRKSERAAIERQMAERARVVGSILAQRKR